MLTKGQLINKIRFMPKDDFKEFSEEVENLIKIRSYHKRFLMYLRTYENSKSTDDLLSVIRTFLKSKDCKIKELRKEMDGESVWVSYNGQPPERKSKSFSCSNYSIFISKFH